jgi:hypothetical protein
LTVPPTRILESTGTDASASGCSSSDSHESKITQRNTGLLWNTCIRTTHRKRAMRVVGYRPHQATFNCTNGACWVSESQADLNAAANRANRLNSWGESLPRKSAGDDSPQGGCQWQAHQDTPPSERDSRPRGGLAMTRVRLAHQRWERGRSRRPVTRTRFETSIKHLVGIPPTVEAPP